MTHENYFWFDRSNLPQCFEGCSSTLLCCHSKISPHKFWYLISVSSLLLLSLLTLQLSVKIRVLMQTSRELQMILLQKFAKYCVSFIHSLKLCHIAITLLSNVWKIMKTAILDVLASLGNKISRFWFLMVAECFFSILPMLLKMFWNCFIPI